MIEQSLVIAGLTFAGLYVALVMAKLVMHARDMHRMFAMMDVAGLTFKHSSKTVYVMFFFLVTIGILLATSWYAVARYGIADYFSDTPDEDIYGVAVSMSKEYCK